MSRAKNDLESMVDRLEERECDAIASVGCALALAWTNLQASDIFVVITEDKCTRNGCLAMTVVHRRFVAVSRICQGPTF